MINEQQRRWAIALLMLVGWVAVVVVGAGQTPEDAPLLGVENLGIPMFAALVATAVLGLIFLIWLMPTSSDAYKGPTKRNRGFWVVLAVALVVLVWNPNFFEALQEAAVEVETGVVEQEAPEVLVAEPAADTVAQASDILLVLIAVGFVAAIAWMAKMRDLETEVDIKRPPIPAEFEAELIDAMSEASVELATSDDPRGGVISAYATLERVLASRSHRREASETAAEHVRRVLAALPVDAEPIVELGRLYDLARFSDVEITVGQQHEARAALDRARRELEAPA